MIAGRGRDTQECTLTPHPAPPCTLDGTGLDKKKAGKLVVVVSFRCDRHLSGITGRGFKEWLG